MEVAFAREVDGAPEEVFGPLLELETPEEPDGMLESHEEVNIAVRSGLPPRDRAEHSEVGRAEPSGQCQEVSTVRSDYGRDSQPPGPRGPRAAVRSRDIPAERLAVGTGPDRRLTEAPDVPATVASEKP
jgi:hypothetical protein